MATATAILTGLDIRVMDVANVSQRRLLSQQQRWVEAPWGHYVGGYNMTIPFHTCLPGLQHYATKSVSLAYLSPGDIYG